MLGDYELEMPDNAWHTHDIRREGQPISTDEFLRRVLTQDMRGVKMVMVDTIMINAIASWVNGDFAEAMEGLK